ncbi:hypothetical protein [Mycobacterium riyadhense]|uniref:hypothetical protein n=1 Tax=Mycobacterium riyadhense TaxID=486698 RepID=UPI00194F51BB|nr:hypothetical protein [Mycobacterium riyadhense]
MTRDLLAAWMYTHPRLRRVWVMFQLLWGGSLLAVLTAPRAAADSITTSLSFTGLHDTYGLPIGSLFVSVLPIDEVIGAQGHPQFGVSPQTWTPALVDALTTTLTYSQLAGWLGLECAFFLCVCAIGIWFIKFALGAIWLGWLATVASPIVANIQALVARLHLVAGGITVSLVAGGILCLTVGYGTGMGVIAGGLLVALLMWTLLGDPAGDLVSDNGLLGMGRSLGFTLSQGVIHNGPIAAGGTSAQLDTLTSWLCDVLTRDIIELISFGQVVDDIPGCAELFNRAILSGITSAPAQAMKSCAPSAYAHSQQLSAVTVGLFALVIFLTMVVLAALDYIGCEAFRIGFKAFWNVLVIVPAAALALFPGPTRRFAKKAATRMLVHAAEMIAATGGLGILVILMAQATRGTLAGMIGMTNPFPKLLVMLLISVFGALGFRHMLRVFGDAGIPGPIRMSRAALNTAWRTGRTLEGIDYTGRKMNDVRSRLANRDSQQPGQGQAETGGVSQKAPGRKPHPPTSTGRPPSGRAGNAPTRPGPSGPGRGPGSSGGSTFAGNPPGRTASPAHAGAAAPTANNGPRPAAAGGRAAVAETARSAAAVAAPELEVPAAAAGALARRMGASRHRHPAAAQHSQSAANGAPGRSGARPDPSNGQSAARRPDRPPPTPPGRTPPRPDRHE